MPSTEIALSTRPSPRLQSYTPPNSPILHPSSVQAITIDHLKQLWVDLVQAAQKVNSTKTEVTKPESTEKPQAFEPRIRASKLEYKTVDEIWDDKDYKYKTVESMPAQDVDELDEYVFVVRIRVDKKTLEETFFIDVKSDRLRDVLRTVLQDVNSVCLRGDKPTIERNILYNYFAELEAYSSRMSDDHVGDLTCLQHLDLLINHIREDYATITNRLVSLFENDEITYDLLWAIYKPSTVLYTTCFGTGKPRCVMYDYGEEKKAQDDTKYYNMTCRYLDYDGSVFGEATTEIVIPKFRGAKRINSLRAFPLRYHQDESTVKASLLATGRKFISLIGSNHRHCQGAAFTFDEKGELVKLWVNSRIMVDAAFFRKINPNYSKPRMGEMRKTNSDSLDFSDFFDYPLSPSNQIKNADIVPTEMKERDFLICCPTVPGFSFGDKIWGDFAVADIKDIEWSSSPFDNLTIPDEHKDVLIALAESHTRQQSNVSFDDFVAGKGRGLSALLHGPPGIGKTFTAEALSEHLRRPLYSISAGELHIFAAKTEASLSHIFEIAAHWGALLLLDEADVFLERRGHDLTRNSLVSIFLRKMEYFQGILFMTSNRASEFDEAILSRVHLMLRYEDLDHDAKTEIWRNFLKKASTAHGKVRVTNTEFERLVATKFNGRQIKNIVATAHALATRDESRVLFGHLQNAVKASEKFIREFTNADHIDRMFS